MDIQAVTYKDFISQVPSFISLDISVSSTGWIRCIDGVYEKGTYTITTPEGDDLGRRKEFRQFLKSIFGDHHYTHVFVEDVIGSVNFKTAKILYQLNPIVDDLIDDGVIHADHIYREDNKVWKSFLKEASGYRSTISAEKNDKKVIMEALYLLGFGDKTTNTIPEDVYDAMGLAVGTIYGRLIKKKAKTVKKLKTDINKGYKVVQASSKEEALKRTKRYKNKDKLLEVDFSSCSRDLKYHFSKLVHELEDDSHLFLIQVPTSKIGVLALTQGFDLDLPISYLLVRK